MQAVAIQPTTGYYEESHISEMLFGKIEVDEFCWIHKQTGLHATTVLS